MKFVKNSAIFSKIFEKNRNFLALIKLQLPKKWPKNAIKMKIAGVDKAPKNPSPPPIPLIIIVRTLAIFAFSTGRKKHSVDFVYLKFKILEKRGMDEKKQLYVRNCSNFDTKPCHKHCK